MGLLKHLVACAAALIAVLLVVPDAALADSLMTIRYADGSTQTVRLDRPSESIRQIEFSEGRMRYGASSSIRVVAGTYGRNCGAQYGNVTDHIAAACDGRSTCEYAIFTGAIGDPAYGCRKDYVAEWQCGTNPERFSVAAGPEAGNGSTIILRCPAR